MNSNDPNEVTLAINNKFDDLFILLDNGDYGPRCCISCDRVMKPIEASIATKEFMEKHGSMLKPTNWNAVCDDLANCYTFKHQDPEITAVTVGMLVSPRASFKKNTTRISNRRATEGFTICQSCKCSLQRTQMPKFAIANNYCFGSPPACLLELNDVELAFLTPVKVYGYCFSYTGGKQKQLKGYLSYYKVNVESVVTAATHFDVLGLTDNIVIMLYGDLTPSQRARLRDRYRMRTSKVLTAMEWLLQNNKEWINRNIILDEVREKLCQPLLIDDSREVDEDDQADSNVEKTDSFQVFFPDGTVSPLTGGQGNIQQFKEFIANATRNGYDLELKAQLMKEAASDYKDNNLTNACLLQYPYGRGGLQERRMRTDGSFTSNTDLQEYAKCCSMNAQSHFHHELFSLILYNIVAKQEMVKTAAFRSRNKTTATQLATQLTDDMVEEAISTKRNGQNFQRNPTVGDKFIMGIDAITKAVPHTNAAAKKARAGGECLQHHFGMSSIFATFCPDDDNSYLVQVYCGIVIDDDTPIESLSDEELTERAQSRTKLRIKHPGICALFFEMMLDIFISEVIGWDVQAGVSHENGGVFGIPEAFVGAIEEQGRRTLHGHFQVWIRNFHLMREKLHSSRRAEQREAKKLITTLVDNTISASLVDFENCAVNDLKKVFDHVCTVPLSSRRIPQVVDDQKLRNLRHCQGEKQSRGIFAFCPHCTVGTWTGPELVEAFLINHVKVPRLSSFPEKNNGPRRLKAMCIEYQKPGTTKEVDSTIVNAAYNHHSHTRSSCFKKSITPPNRCTASNNQNQSHHKKRKSDLHAECRYRMPARKKRYTLIQDADDAQVEWCSWHGSIKARKIKEICIARHEYDGYQNSSINVLDNSKFTCNSNGSGVMPGPVGQYQFKYNMKGNQEEETREYEIVSEASSRMLSKLRKHDGDRAETARRLLGAAFAHQTNNVVGAPLASFLTRNKSRFIFSHSFQWCPLRDLRSLLKGGSVGAIINYHGNTPFFVSLAMNYLCRPKELEDWSAFRFYTEMEVVRHTATNADSLLALVNTAEFQHPSYQSDKETFLQGARERNNKVLIKIYQYDFADALEFGGSLLDAALPINSAMEEYSELVLLLFKPYRNLEDLLGQNRRYTDSLREFASSGLLSQTARQFLQNIQDTKSNSFRTTSVEDDLQRETELFVPAGWSVDDLEHDQEDDAESTLINGARLDELLQFFNSVQIDDDDIEGETNHLSFKTLRNKGVLQCGYKDLAEVTIANEGRLETVYETTANDDDIRQEQADDQNDHDHENNNDEVTESSNPTSGDLVSILMTRTSRVCKSFEDITGIEEEVDIYEANGSVRSIIDWAIKANLDPEQRRAFEIMAGQFVLTFYNDADTSARRGTRHDFIMEKKRLEVLVEKVKRRSQQMILFLHGPGGSGKSTVIFLVIAYAREFCSHMDNFSFTSRTILVTAMSGVAATLLKGETTQRACHLNRKTLQPEHIELFEETRMVIIDEVSFASKTTYKKLHRNLCYLYQCLSKKYGGKDICFAGDMRQLEPPSQYENPVYKDHCPEFKDWVNCYIVLKGIHRFRLDLEWGRLLMRFRDGTITVDDINRINNRCVVSDSTILPQNIQYATYFNRDRDAINTALFEERTRNTFATHGSTSDCIVVLADNLMIRDSQKKYVPFSNAKAFYRDCGEDDAKPPRSVGRFDPVLKLYYNGPQMLPSNKDVSRGQANGTRALFKQAVLRPGVVPFDIVLDDGVPVKAVHASQVSHLVMEHVDKSITPAVFHLEPTKITFTARLLKPSALQTKPDEREYVKMKGTQFLTISNNATTGHKLQGAGVESLFVHSWSYVQNWTYVALSRVKTISGLFCRKKLSTDLQKYAVPEALKKMLSDFEERAPTYWSESEYEELFG